MDVYNSDNTFFNNGHEKAKLKIFDMLYGKSKKPCPYDMLTDEVRIFCSNLKSCKSNKENGNIKKFDMKHKNQKKNNMCIFVPKTAVNNGNIYKTYLGKMEGLDKLQKNTNDCRINYLKYENRYELLVTVHIGKKKIKNREKKVALDPGEKVFIAYYSENKFGKIGENIREKILKEEQKIRKFQRILNQKINLNGDTLKNKKGIERKIKKAYTKIKNIVKELHNKTAKYLCENCEKILIPIFETQKMVKKKEHMKDRFNEIKEKEGEEKMKEELKKVTKTRRLNGRVKFVLNMLSHYKFRQHLINKSNEYGCLVEVVTEEYTSKTCTKCGYMSESYNKREKKCLKCGYQLDRDFGGSRNIMIKNC